MSNGIKIEMVSSADSSLYSRSAASKLISSDDTPSSPPLTSKVLQIASGRRKGFEPKNDPNGESRTEKQVSSRVPRFENGELKLPTEKFDAVATDTDAVTTTSSKTDIQKNGNRPNSTEPKITDPIETPLSPKLRQEYGGNIIQLNVSPIPARKDAANSSVPPKEELNPLPVVSPVITNLPTSSRKTPSPKSSGRRINAPVKDASGKEVPRSEISNRRPVETVSKGPTRNSDRREAGNEKKEAREDMKEVKGLEEKKEEREGSPPAGRRSSLTKSPPTSLNKTATGPTEPLKPRSRTSDSRNKSKKDKRPEKDDKPSRSKTVPANIHYEYKSIISQPDPTQHGVHGPERYSNRRQYPDDRGGEWPNSDSRHRPHRPKEISKPKQRSKDRDSSVEPRMPRDNKPSIRIEGRKATSRDMFESSGSFSGGSTSSSRQSESSTTETTSRRKIKTRSEALDKKLIDAFPDGEFSPEDDDHLKFAIHTALEESRAKSVQEAIDAGHELNAEVLKSLTRPNAIEEVIETMVSQRRDQIREKRASERRQQSRAAAVVQPKKLTAKAQIRDENEPIKDREIVRKSKNAKSSVKKSIVVKKAPQEELEESEDEAEEETTRLAKRKVKASSKSGSKSRVGKTVKKAAIVKKVVEEEIDDADEDKAEEDSEDPQIETIEEPQDPILVLDGEGIAKAVKTPKDSKIQVTTPNAKEETAPTKAKSKLIVDDGTPKDNLPGVPLLIPTLLKKQETETVEVIGGQPKGPLKSKKSKAATKTIPAPNPEGGVAVVSYHVDEDGEVSGKAESPVADDEEMEEVTVKKTVRAKRTVVEEESNVKLPRENRKIRKGDYLEQADELGNRDYVYDPLGVDQPFGDEDDSVGDELYEESSEDDSKLTIAEKKDEMLYRFKLIKEAYPGIALPRITKRMKLAKMVRLYEHVMSRIKLKVKTNNFKIFLVIGFLAMQFAAKKFGADAAGFTINQMTSMKHYEKYLREIGESDFSSFGSDLPVMIRLPFFMAVNMGIFLVAKWIFKKTGKDYTTQFHKLYAQLTGGDDYVYIKEEGGTAGLDAGGGADDGGGGGIFGMIKSFLGMMGSGGDSGGEDKPKRGEAAGPTYKRKRKPATEG